MYTAALRALTEVNKMCYGSRGEECTDHTCLRVSEAVSEGIQYRGEEAHTTRQGGRYGKGSSAYRTQKTPESQVMELEFLLYSGMYWTIT